MGSTTENRRKGQDRTKHRAKPMARTGQETAGSPSPGLSSKALQKAESAHDCSFRGEAEEAQGSSWLVIKGHLGPGQQSFYF